MEMIPVSSSNLSSVGYENSTLRIHFKSGGIYEYNHVPESVYRGLMAASSKGTYHAQHIKNNYTFTRIR